MQRNFWSKCLKENYATLLRLKKCRRWVYALGSRLFTMDGSFRLTFLNTWIIEGTFMIPNLSIIPHFSSPYDFFPLGWFPKFKQQIRFHCNFPCHKNRSRFPIFHYLAVWIKTKPTLGGTKTLITVSLRTHKTGKFFSKRWKNLWTMSLNSKCHSVWRLFAVQTILKVHKMCSILLRKGSCWNWCICSWTWGLFEDAFQNFLKSGKWMTVLVYHLMLRSQICREKWKSTLVQSAL